MPTATADNAHTAVNGFLIAAQGIAKRDQLDFIGRLDDAVWARAEPVRFATNYAGKEAGIRTSVRFAWSPRGLFVLWQLDHAGLNTDRSRPIDVERSKLYQEDCVELFLSPGTKSRRQYFEIEVGPFGHFLDLRVDLDEKRWDTEWSSGLDVGTRRNTEANTAVIEMVLRQAEITTLLRPGAQFRIGLFRMEGSKPRHYLAWRPPRTAKPNFHVPEAFGTLVLDP